MANVRFAILLTALTLAGCAGAQVTFEDTAPKELSVASMDGRWIMAAPNAPPCGMNFSTATGGKAGRVLPEGGCPGRFYLTRRWSLAGDMLTLSDNDGQSLGALKAAGDRYEGESATGLRVTLSR